MSDMPFLNDETTQTATSVVELEGRSFIPAEKLPLPEWPGVPAQRLQPTLTLKDDDLFLITDTIGNIGGYVDDEAGASLGLFCRDTRFLSRLELQISGRAPILLSSTAQRGFALSVLCTNPHLGSEINAETIGIQRDIVLNGGLFEELIVTNYSTNSIKFDLSISFNADFADLFQVRGFTRNHTGTLMRQVRGASEEHYDLPSIQALALEAGELVLAYQGLDGALMESQIQFNHRQPNSLEGYTAIWQIELGSHETTHLGYRLRPMINGSSASVVSAPITLKQALAAESMEEEDWQSAVTQIRTNDRTTNQIIERAEHDVYLMRQTFGTGKVLSAGIPWFSTLFGRDSIIAALQTLIFDPRIARQTLIALASYQGRVENQWREEEPGKILHELRLGEMARSGEVPHTPYYGSVDATPLWLILYADYYAWTHDEETLDRLWENALAAMNWIDRGCQETGYLSYECRSKGGLRNQGWKDSGDCIVNHKGELAEGSIALSEVQGYIYAAKMRLSEIARMKHRIHLADRWFEEAQDLKMRFNRDFWLPHLDYCALALDGDGNPVDSISSNPGHCLSVGIFSPERANSIAERLQAPDMFNGWGIRTLSSLSPAYNPMGYHIGSVWPHDNSIVAMGLRSIGRVDQALEVSQGIFDMTAYQPYLRPPELFCGHERMTGSRPIRYPVACSPQAWATGAIFHFLQMMLNLVPEAAENRLRIVNPVLPDSIHQLRLTNLKLGSTLLDLEFIREESSTATACRVTKKRGNLRVVIEA
ncbi:MAG: amylo-alpha-1,6-glucosidase [Elainellaceae cyanobacterium]